MTAARAPVAVVVVTWNSAGFIRACLESLRGLRRPPAETVVADSGSTDETVAIVRASFPEVALVECGRNVGYCRASNLGISRTSAPFVLALNPDTRLDPSFLEELLPAFDDPGVGMAAGKLLRFDGTTLDSAGQELARSRQPHDRGYGVRDEGQFDADGEVFGACGAAALYRREMLDSVADPGGAYFDEGFFAFYEDLDLAWRARRLGWKAAYRHRAVGYHARGGDIGPDRSAAMALAPFSGSGGAVSHRQESVPDDPQERHRGRLPAESALRPVEGPRDSFGPAPDLSRCLRSDLAGARPLPACPGKEAPGRRALAKPRWKALARAPTPRAGVTRGADLSRWLLYLLSFGLATGVSLWLTPRMREAALRFGIVDRPDGRLKNQREPVPYLGGIAIYLSFLLAISITYSLSGDVLGILLAGSIVVLLGLLDDLGQLTVWTKLAGQCVAVLVLIKSGISIQLAFLHPAVAIALSVLWLIATTNAFNLIDIMDGMSAGTAVIAAAALLIVADWNGRVTAATMLAALAGACLGFLRYNFEPARIYMGDTGSLFLGLSLGALAMNNAYTEVNDVAALSPALILGVPLFDMLFVMYVRWRRGLPILLGSPDHVALRLRQWRLTTRKTVLLSYVASALLAAAAIVMSVVPGKAAAGILAGILSSAVVSAVLLKKIDMRL